LDLFLYDHPLVEKLPKKRKEKKRGEEKRGEERERAKVMISYQPFLRKIS